VSTPNEEREDVNHSNALELFNGQSPFDQIRQVRADGAEFWSARDLMPIMGYTAWRNFRVPLERAMTSAGNQGHDVIANFAGSRKASRTNPAEDFQLSRFAAYLVAMNGDPNKPEVAAAQAYFAIRTREAEVAPVRRELTEDEIVQQALAITTRKVEALTAKVAELEPAAKSWNHLADAEGNFAVADAAKILSQDPDISIGRDRLFAFMESVGWVYRQAGKRGGWRAYQSQVDIGRLYERPARPFLNTRTGDMELPAPTVRVAAKGVAKLRELLVARAAA
jgi:DNA-damage-inducible protein D